MESNINQIVELLSKEINVIDGRILETEEKQKQVKDILYNLRKEKLDKERAKSLITGEKLRRKMGRYKKKKDKEQPEENE